MKTGDGDMIGRRDNKATSEYLSNPNYGKFDDYSSGWLER